MSTAAVSHRDRRRALVAGAVGNGFEWYDWTIYALLATWFAKKFFPGSIPSAALLSSFAVFAVGFLARPLGGLVFGWLTERRGRAACLKIAITLMALAGLAMGLAPTSSVIGSWAAVCTVVTAVAAASAPAVFFAAIASFPATAIALHVNSDTAYLVNAIALALMVALMFVAPRAAERWGLRSVWSGAILLNALVIAVGFAIFYAHPPTAFTVQLAIVIPFAFVQGTVQALCVSTLHPNVIGLAMGTAWTIPASLIGGTAPMLMAWANKHGHPMYFIWYLVSICLIAGVVVLALGRPRPVAATGT